MVIYKGNIYLKRDDGMYVPVTFHAIPGGVIMQQGEPVTLDEILGSVDRLPKHINMRCVLPTFDEVDLKGAALLKKLDEEWDGQ